MEKKNGFNITHETLNSVNFTGIRVISGTLTKLSPPSAMSDITSHDNLTSVVRSYNTPGFWQSAHTSGEDEISTLIFFFFFLDSFPFGISTHCNTAPLR